MPSYDLVIRGGTVIDPAAGLHAQRDVAIGNGTVTAVAESIPADQAGKTIDASGKLVVPGLIDLHAHLFDGYGSGTPPDASCLARGTTTAYDGGSVGVAAFKAFKTYIIDPSRTRVKSWLHISRIGLIDTTFGEATNLIHLDPEAAVRMAEANRDTIIGFKARLSSYVTGGTCKPLLRLLRQAADAASLPVMCHIGESIETLPEILSFLKPGDVITHTLTGRRHGILDYNGKVWPAVREARSSGILFDAAHGRGHFGFNLIRRALDQGFLPDTMSTDITSFRAADPTFHLPLLMSKLIALGVGLDEAIALSTSNAARWMKRSNELGTLQPGAIADVAILEELEGDFTFDDNEGQTMSATKRLRPVLTLKGGEAFEASADS
jgi:dihydroorotase